MSTNHEFEASKVNIVREMFIRTADENYVTARWCWQSGLRIDFCWLAAHALEKYMKSVLLLNGLAANCQGHDISNLLTQIQPIAGPLIPLTLKKPDQLKHVPWTDMAVEHYICAMRKKGDASNRYLVDGYAIHSEYLWMLDSIVFAVRRLTSPLDQRWLDTDEPGAPTFTNREFLTNNLNHVPSLHLPLDRLIESTEDSPARSAALNLNFEFAPKNFIHRNMPTATGSLNPVIFRTVLQQLASNDPQQAAQGIEIANWLVDNIHIPSKTGYSPT